ncbi:hypothetical protein ABOM_007389 [Aspergillus bombycis]|uniref:Nucleoside phosphorylase domain-containing protein n=1 Tax=Aspergillus bombycis TaxID=109264 RepID=A0A1F7ZZ85_9EURO|nr:hypothetical protein ABOM_007389 [Aspergillus bombycis]OGM44770.1 hypothetical protein ABOM_007389 [Aspergillus bombycis]
MATDTTLLPPVLRTHLPHTEFLVSWICVLKKEYYAALRTRNERAHNVTINLPPAEMYGQIHASHIAADMRSTFPRMRFVLLVGIAGGAPSPKHDIRLGDVVLVQAGLVQIPSRQLFEAITFVEERLWSEDVHLSESIGSIGAKFTKDAEHFLRPTQDRLNRDVFTHRESECDCLRPESRQRVNLGKRDDRTKYRVQLFQGAIGSGNQVMKNAQS